MDVRTLLKTAKDLQAELDAVNAQLEVTKKQEAIEALKREWSVKDKVAAFDRLQKQALEYAQERIEKDYRDEDIVEYLYEAVVMETLGKNAFEVLRQFG